MMFRSSHMSRPLPSMSTSRVRAARCAASCTTRPAQGAGRVSAAANGMQLQAHAGELATRAAAAVATIMCSLCLATPMDALAAQRTRQPPVTQVRVFSGWPCFAARHSVLPGGMKLARPARHNLLHRACSCLQTPHTRTPPHPPPHHHAHHATPRLRGTPHAAGGRAV